MTRKILITEDEKNNISNQHSEIDGKLMNFLLRRVNVNEKQIGSEEDPIKFIEVRFTDFSGYGFTNFMSKKDMERSIFTMLYENDVVEDIDEMDERNPERVKIVKTIRQFLNFILPKK
jgi:UTP-glucose-1-phosphate uridylyltransferase